MENGLRRPAPASAGRVTMDNRRDNLASGGRREGAPHRAVRSCLGHARDLLHGRAFLRRSMSANCTSRASGSPRMSPASPPAVMGEAGEGGPVIAILGEYDALPGLKSGSWASPRHRPIEEGGHGHGCGHNLLGSAAMLAAVGLKRTGSALNRASRAVSAIIGCPPARGKAVRGQGLHGPRRAPSTRCRCGGYPGIPTASGKIFPPGFARQYACGFSSSFGRTSHGSFPGPRPHLGSFGT